MDLLLQSCSERSAKPLPSSISAPGRALLMAATHTLTEGTPGHYLWPCAENAGGLYVLKLMENTAGSAWGRTTEWLRPRASLLQGAESLPWLARRRSAQAG